MHCHFVLIIGLATIGLGPQIPSSTQVAPERQLDFWVGEWQLQSRQRAAPGQEKWVERKASNSVRKILGGKVIEENFNGSALPTPFNGKSVSVYSANLKKWQQTWVDDSGGYLDFVGEFADGKMIFWREATVNGKTFRQRMVFHDITKDRFVWDWERSVDGGATWILQWRITYARKKTAKSTP
jgi:hypothetical protein